MMRVRCCLFIILSIFLIIPVGANQKVRPYLKAGDFWYPSSRASLELMLKQFFSQARKISVAGRIRGLVAPHAGFQISGLCAARAYKQVQGELDFHRVIVLGVAHRGQFYGACVSDFTHNATPLGNITVDTDVTRTLAGHPLFRLDNRIMQFEHSIENQLPFLQWALKGGSYKIVPILVGALKPQDVATMASTLKKYIDHHTLVVASTDFTHYGRAYGYLPFANHIKGKLTQLDMGMIRPILQIDLKKCRSYKQKTGITMCGFTPVSVLLAMLSAAKHEGKLIDYYKSADRTGDYSLSVSYAALVFYEKGVKGAAEKSSGLKKGDQQQLLKLARLSIDHYLRHQKYLPGTDLYKKQGKLLNQKAGVFVTLKIDDQLRGCIGSIVGVEPLYLGVIKNAVNAAVHDPRFRPLQLADLERITIEISVMTPLQKIKNYRKIRLGTDGVIIRKSGRQAVFLPQVATETGWNLDQFLSALCRKAGLWPEAYRQGGMDFYIFQAQVFGENH